MYSFNASGIHNLMAENSSGLTQGILVPGIGKAFGVSIVKGVVLYRYVYGILEKAITNHL